ncbi:MAG TPA: hypothetical protein VFC90_04150 [Planctomycetota bacterium]|nr:hypothetical protein [Planctomycetota bacterium]
MKRFAAKGRFGAASAAVLAAGCASYDDMGSTSSYVIGALFVIVGLALAAALVISLNEG